VLLTSALTQFFDPAHASVLPEVAADEELAAANSLMAISSFGSTAVGFAASGLIASRFPIEWAFYLDGASFLLSAACIASVRILPLAVEGAAKVSVLFRNMRSGLQFLYGKPILRSIFILYPLICVSFGLSNALLLPFAIQALGATEFEYGLQEGLTSLGFVAASLLMARVADRLREGQWVTLGLIGTGVFSAVYASLSSVPLALVLVTITGFTNAPYSIARGLVIQRNTPRDFRGRVSSVFFVTRDVAFLVGMATAGLADVFDVRVMMLASALMVLAPGALALVLPGLGQPAAEWRRAVSLLRGAPAAPRLDAGRPATLADVEALAGLLPSLSGLSDQDRRELTGQARVVQAATGTTILRAGDKSDAAYFILAGRAIAGLAADGDYRSLETMSAGDFFGEIAALTGAPRTANVVSDEPTSLLVISASSLRTLMQAAPLGALVRAKFVERAQRTNLNELPRFAGFDQQALRELRQAEE